jgi:hypothetical protein
MNSVPIQSPDRAVYFVPIEECEAALRAGGVMVAPVVSPDDRDCWVPVVELEKAVLSGGVLKGSDDQPRDDHGRWTSGGGGDSSAGPDKDGKWDVAAEGDMEKFYNEKYPEVKEGEKVDGRTVLEDVDNMSSISASMSNYLILDGVREVNFNEFDMPADVTARTQALAEEIKTSNEITPLIIGVDHVGPYVMEGSHRYDALKILGAQKIPAIVVLDLDELQKSSKVRKDYNPDQPRDDHGRFGSTGEGAEASKDQKNMEVLDTNMSTFEAHSAMIRNEARRQGYPVEKVSVVEGAQNFKVGDREFALGGTAAKDGTITMYPGAFQDQVNLTGMPGLMSHEIEHTRFNAVMSVYDQESSTLRGWASNSADHDKFDAVTRGNGYLDPEKSSEQFPVMSKLEPYIDENRDKMTKDDGVTDYSTAYWNAMSENKGVNYRTAVSETLSEISRLKTDGNAKGNVSRDWLNFHSAVNKLAKSGGL